jgi:lipoate-protein ligase B
LTLRGDEASTATTTSAAPSLSFDHTRVVPFRAVGPAPYAPLHALQQRLLEERIAERTPDVLLVGEHERVVTLGRATKGPSPALPIPVVAIERGGQATWHGPGQLVVYPIVSLVRSKLDVRGYLHALEEAIVRTIARFGVAGERRDGATGVWVGVRKVASIGVAIRRRVAWHGLALNVAPDLADFGLIDPCGFSSSVMTSMAQLLAQSRAAPPAVADVAPVLVDALVRELRLAPAVWERPALA